MPKVDFQENQITIKNNGLHPYTVTITKEGKNYTVKKNNEIVIQTNGEAPKLETKNIFLKNYKGRRGDYYLTLTDNNTKIALGSKREINRGLGSYRMPGSFYNKEIHKIAEFLGQEHPVYQGNQSKRLLNKIKDMMILGIILAVFVALAVYHRDYIMMLAEKYEGAW